MTWLLASILLSLLALSGYLFFLGSLHRRDHPVLITGRADAFALLGGMSGILLFLGPHLIHRAYLQTLLHPRAVETQQAAAKEAAPLRKPHEALPVERWPREGDEILLTDKHWSTQPIEEIWWTWHLVWLGYFLLLLLGGSFLIWRRRNQTVLYSADVKRLADDLASSLTALGLTWRRDGSIFFIGPTSALAVENSTAITKAPTKFAMTAELPKLPARGQLIASAVIWVASVRSMDTATLHWRACPAELRQEIEADLRNRLVAPESTKVGAWFYVFSSVLCTAAFLTAALLVFYVYSISRR